MNRNLSEIQPLFYPIDTPPSPDLDLSANDGPKIIAVGAFLLAITAVIVSLRFTARYLSTAGIWWDDWLCLAAAVLAWGCCILGFISTSYNFGRHEALLSEEDAVSDTTRFFKGFYAYQTMYTLSVTLAKASIIVFYGRIFTERAFKRALWIVSGFVFAWFVAVQVIQLVECRPLHALWDGTSVENCIDLIEFFIVVGAINCVINFVLLIMPLPMIWGLEIGNKVKVGLSLTFLLGVFVFAVSVARLFVISKVQNVDVTWSYVDTAIWTTAEPCIAVCSASLPILRSLWVLLRPRSSAQSSLRSRSQSIRRYGKHVDFEDALEDSDGGGPPERNRAEVAAKVIRPPPASPAHVAHGKYRPPPTPPKPRVPSIPPVPPIPPTRSQEFSRLTALDMSHTRPGRSDMSDIISPLSARSQERSPYHTEWASRASSAQPSRARSLVSKFSPMATTPARGNASPYTERSDSPQTIEMNRLPIQGSMYDIDYDYYDDASTIRETRRGRPSEASPEISRAGSGRSRHAGRRAPSASRRSSQARGEFDRVLPRSRSSIHRPSYAVELDARENRRFSIKRTR